jgi:type II secretory pathway pseudopilin PulG
VLLVVAITVAVPSYFKSRKVANESAAVRNVRTITIAEQNFQSSNGRYGDLQALISARLLDTSFKGPNAGYSFAIENSGDDYTATATPVSAAEGRYGYYSTSDTIIRYSRDPALAPSGQAEEPVD